LLDFADARADEDGEVIVVLANDLKTLAGEPGGDGLVVGGQREVAGGHGGARDDLAAVYALLEFVEVPHFQGDFEVQIGGDFGGLQCFAGDKGAMGILDTGWSGGWNGCDAVLEDHGAGGGGSRAGEGSDEKKEPEEEPGGASERMGDGHREVAGAGTLPDFGRE